jgi:pimeloyl-ACP methyl ester carboxylesterase
MSLPLVFPLRSRLLGALLFCSAFNLAAADRALPLRECRLESTVTAGSVAAKCGAYRVAENRDQPQGKELQLHVAVVPALQLKPAADPLFILSGGPGQAASDLYLSVAPAFARVRRNRDIVLIDQRGTGKSNRLDCTFPEDGDFTLVEPAELHKIVQGCLASLPGDPRFYTTSVAVRDLDEVRAALGYSSINLYGISYGTRVAQHYMRRHPDRVRAVILDGVVPAELALGPDVAIEAQRALDSAFARCAGEERCNRAFPDIARQFHALQERLQAQPERLSIANPLSAAPTAATLGRAELSAAVRLLSYADETVSLLPLLIHEAQSARQPQALAALYLMIKRALDAQFANAMHFSVVCSEDAPRWQQANVSDDALARTYMGTVFMMAMKTICADWPRGPVDADFNQPLRSRTPVLLLSGGGDPITPPRYAEQALAGLSNARHLVLDGQGHGQFGTGCVPRISADFLARGSVVELDDACAANITAAPFMLTRSASAP